MEWFLFPAECLYYLIIKKKVNGKLQIGKILFYFVYFNVKFSDFCVVKSATLA